MPYVIYDKRSGKYVDRVTSEGVNYTFELQKAKVYKTKAGALNAVGEKDKSYSNLGKYPPSNTLKFPSYVDLIEVTITDSGIRKSAYDVGVTND